MSLLDISWYGPDAADAAAEYLDGSRHGLSRRDAIEIIGMVQERGCDLRGTRAYQTLRRVRAGGALAPDELVVADFALRSIEQQWVAPPGTFDRRTDGPCWRGTP